jgi:hypothetical protein
MQTTTKQQPLIDRLSILLSDVKAVATALADNSIDDRLPVDPAVLSCLHKELIAIRRQLDAAS